MFNAHRWCYGQRPIEDRMKQHMGGKACKVARWSALQFDLPFRPLIGTGRLLSRPATTVSKSSLP